MSCFLYIFRISKSINANFMEFVYVHILLRFICLLLLLLFPSSVALRTYSFSGTHNSHKLFPGLYVLVF